MNGLSPDRCVLAIDAGGTTIKFGLVISDAPEQGALETGEIPVPSDGSAAAIAEAYAEAGRICLEGARKRHLTPVGTGVSTPGPFDYQAGISLMTHKYAAIRGMSIRSFIERGTGPLPIRFIHDSFAFLLGELSATPRINAESPCAAVVGTGLGFAAMRGGRLLTAPGGGPGISIYGRPFRTGIAEDYVSKRGLSACYARLGGTDGKSVREMDLAARSGDELCVRVFAESGRALAEIVAPILTENRFDLLLLGGQIAKAGPLMAIPAAERLAELGVGCAVETACRIDTAPLIGAARLFQEGEAFL